MNVEEHRYWFYDAQLPVTHCFRFDFCTLLFQSQLGCLTPTVVPEYNGKPRGHCSWRSSAPLLFIIIFFFRSSSTIRIKHKRLRFFFFLVFRKWRFAKVSFFLSDLFALWVQWNFTSFCLRNTTSGWASIRNLCIVLVYSSGHEKVGMFVYSGWKEPCFFFQKKRKWKCL